MKSERTRERGPDPPIPNAQTQPSPHPQQPVMAGSARRVSMPVDDATPSTTAVCGKKVGRLRGETKSKFGTTQGVMQTVDEARGRIGPIILYLLCLSHVEVPSFRRRAGACSACGFRRAVARGPAPCCAGGAPSTRSVARLAKSSSYPSIHTGQNFARAARVEV